MKHGIGTLAILLALASCSTIQFYAPEIDAQWTTTPVQTTAGRTSAAGVTVGLKSQVYSKVVGVGNLLAPAYEGSRTETWSIEGADGYKATLEIVQNHLIFSGPMDKNVLSPNTTDLSKAQTTLRLSDGQTVVETSLAGASPVVDVSLAGVTLKPTYQGTEKGSVRDLSSWGIVMGVRVTQGEKLVGYLSRSGQFAVVTPPGAPASSLAWGLVLALNQPHFEAMSIPKLVYDAAPGEVLSHS
jgi:hypothetical protein